MSVDDIKASSCLVSYVAHQFLLNQIRVDLTAAVAAAD